MRPLYHKTRANASPIVAHMANGIQISGLGEVRRALARLAWLGGDVDRALVRCGRVAVREAKANAPRSPTNAVLSATLRRKRRTARRTFPGGLEKSIQSELAAHGRLSVFVASNAPAGRYARRIHDEKGRTWFKRGPGTVAKGSRADEKFVERAIRDNAGNFAKIIKSEIERRVR